MMKRWMMGSGEERRASPWATLAALVLASATLMTLDHAGGGEDSVVEPVRRVVGEAFGPVQEGASYAVRPFTSVPEWMRTQKSLQAELTQARARNAELRQQLETAGFKRNRLAEYEGLTRAADHLGYAMVPARVISFGPAQSFTRTVTIDAGTAAGVRPDQTVVNNDGLVGRVLRVTAGTATVLLISDADSIVGGRIGESMELGFLHGRGSVSEGSRLDLELIDDRIVPAEGDTVVTWGSEDGAPYVAGIPVGRVSAVFSSVRDSSRRAVIEPFVDFSSLDVVGVVVPSGTRGDRAVIEADGSLR